jgi:hypothetical protein
MPLRILLAAVFAAAVYAASAQANPISFECITGNLPGDCAIGESQLSVEISDQGGGVVRFHFRNVGLDASVISEVYFDDGSLLALSTVIDGPGVDFEPDANPPDLPGGDSIVPPFEVTEGFLAESVPAPSQNGVGPGEWVMIEFTLQGGQTFADVLAELASGELRIGVHVIAFESGGSESFVNVPEPAAGALLTGAALVARARTRRRGA